MPTPESQSESKIYRVLVADKLGDSGVEKLRAEPDFEVLTPPKLDPKELLAQIAEVHALVVRSATQVTAEVLAAAPHLVAVVRAGAGTDNIDLDAATARGVIVMNTPGGNTNAAAEHTLAMMLALARRVPMANRSLRDGKWERERFVGWELRGKTLGIVGLGRIGSEVATRAQAFRMQVVAYDPFISREVAASRDIRLLSLEELLAESDVVSLHSPSIKETEGLIDQKALARMKPKSHLINCARGTLIDEQALLGALDDGRLGGAALDVFHNEPTPLRDLIDHPNVVATPHLGASTLEAKDSVGIQAARQVIGVLKGQSFENAINVPIRDGELLERLRPYLNLAEKLGAMQAQLVEGGIREVTLDVAGSLEDTAPLRLSYLRGLLSPIDGASVNYVNASYVAQERGITVSESRSAQRDDYATVVTSTVVTDDTTHTLRGTVTGKTPRIVEIDSFWTDALPEGSLLLCKSVDRPGAIGMIGTACGQNNLNISQFRLGRTDPGGDALSIITLDAPPSQAALAALRALPDVLSVKSLSL